MDPQTGAAAVAVSQAGAGWLQYGALGLLGLVVLVVLLGGGFLVYKAFGALSESVNKLTAALQLFDSHDAQRDLAIVNGITNSQSVILAGVNTIAGTVQARITDEIHRSQDTILGEVRRVRD